MTAVKRIKENVVENELVRRVKEMGGVAEKVTVIGRRGYFDRLVVLPGGRVFFVECKRPRGGVVSSHQRQRHAIYRMLGAVVVILRRVEDIDSILNSKLR